MRCHKDHHLCFSRSLHVRHWDKWAPYVKRNHLFLLPLDIESRRLRHASASGQSNSPVDAAANATSASATSSSYVAIDIMFKWLSDCPEKCAGADSSSFTISPDGSKIAFACRSTLPDGGQPADMAWSTESSVFIYDVPGSEDTHAAATGTVASAVKISGDSQAKKACPVFSPCSRYVA